MHISRLSQRWMAIAGAMSVLIVAGCSSQAQGPSKLKRHRAGDFASTRLLNNDIAAVRPAADQAFKGQSFRIDPAASSTNLWVSRPQEITEHNRPERLRDFLRGPTNRHRQLAQLQLTQESGHVLVLCRVAIQRLDTSERAAFARARDTGDAHHNDTPINREETVRSDSREEWVDIGRDRHAERLILDAIRRALSAG